MIADDQLRQILLRTIITDEIESGRSFRDFVGTLKLEWIAILKHKTKQQKEKKKDESKLETDWLLQGLK